jgi:hypothetical protein
MRWTRTFQKFYFDREPRFQYTFKKIHIEGLITAIILHFSHRVMAPSLGTDSRPDLAFSSPFFWLFQIAPRLLSVNKCKHDKFKFFLVNGLGKVITYHSHWHVHPSWKLVIWHVSWWQWDSWCLTKILVLAPTPASHGPPASSGEFPISISCGFFAGFLNPAREKRF